MLPNLKEKLSKQRSGIIFMVKMVLSYSILLGIYEWYLSPHTRIDFYIIQQIISQGEWILNILGYSTLNSDLNNPNLMGVSNSTGVIIGGPCDGLSLFILYSTFILSFSGKWWTKGISIIIGVGIIHLLNVLRVVALALIVVYAPSQLDFHHSYTFTLFVYGVVFSLWILRIKIYKWTQK